ncbi:MAG: flavin-dependent oxidoreductase [Chromatiales bacterium]|jgi:5-methylphenazine-1-carboxylate 1-monooxygenase|nr:flavin-dependent oxidoreductase [Chromatiales bacterium]
MSVLIAGAGIGGLTLALRLHQHGIHCRIFEAVPTIEPVGVGINLLPHAMRELSELGLTDELVSAGIETREMHFYNRFGQFIFAEPRGVDAGYEWPQVSLHRGTLQRILLQAVVDRLGQDAITTGRRLVFADQNPSSVIACFDVAGQGGRVEEAAGEVLIGCDGIHSTVRRLLYPAPDPLKYSGITMWRGVTRWAPILGGATMAYAGWLKTGKLIVYPIDDTRDAKGRQLINWLVEFYVPPREPNGDWSRPGAYEDFLWAVEDMQFDWLDVPAFVKAADFVYEYPMVDRDPLPYWSDGRITLLGDAAHPMYPRGSNGAGQAILDATALADLLADQHDPLVALHMYDDVRRPATTAVVEANRTNPPDAILREVYERTGDKPFDNINDVVSRFELKALSDQYKRVAGFDAATMRER